VTKQRMWLPLRGSVRSKKRARVVILEQSSSCKVARKGYFVEPAVYKNDFGDFKSNGSQPELGLSLFSACGP
jgi:hypothetical protein